VRRGEAVPEVRETFARERAGAGRGETARLRATARRFALRFRSLVFFARRVARE